MIRFLVMPFFRKTAHSFPSWALCAVRLCVFICFLVTNLVTLGKYWVAYTKYIGYGPGFEIEDDGAAIVRRIFKYALQGYSSTKIARLLEENGIPTPRNGTCWHESTVMSILRNEKYKGDALLHKGTVAMIQIATVPFNFSY